MPKPAKPVVLKGRAGSNPAPRAILLADLNLQFVMICWKYIILTKTARCQTDVDGVACA